MKKLLCWGCKQRFPAETMIKLPVGNVHSIECATKHVRINQDKQRANQMAKMAASIKKEEKAARAQHRADKDRVKTLAQWKREAQSAFNSYIRARDDGLPCISCDQSSSIGQRHASHYRSVGACSQLRFNTFNVHASCAQCNGMKSGNILEYRIRLIKKLGADRVEWLECQNQPTKYDVEYLKRVKRIFTKRKKLTINKGEIQ